MVEDQTWRTRDGREIALRDLEDDHLRSILAMVRRKLRGELLRLAMEADSYAADAPDGAADAATREAMVMMDVAGEGDPRRMLDALPDGDQKALTTAVVDEAERRGIVVQGYPCCLGVEAHRPGCRRAQDDER